MFHLTPCYAAFEIRNQWLYPTVTGLDKICIDNTAKKLTQSFSHHSNVLYSRAVNIGAQLVVSSQST
jgi:hypothetical protein